MANFITCPCQHCNNHIEFDAEMLVAKNQVVSCPHCGKETALFVPEPINSSKTEGAKTMKSKYPSLILVGCVVLFGLALYHNHLHSQTNGSSSPSPSSPSPSSPDKLSTVQENKSEDNETASEELYSAVQKQDLSAVRAAITKGADVNRQYSGGLTALICACKTIDDSMHDQNPNVIENADEIVSLLLEKGADVNMIKDDGYTALMGAVSFGDAKMVKILLAKGADVNAKDNTGCTPLIFATINVQVENVSLLLASGADVNAKMANGSTALDFARDSNHDDIVQLLKQAGARE